ncbi:CaiB/BaiF CoA-transferase family protein [Kaistia dalseonensis]|uniref:Crotonobetainyl-CoA:carnitine CoA-transferase CaiB-like acyl-CoA transferase n=1 Tax=Kaistia dalseonensis TaxID=410840 RepID=A0ABU0H2Q7_9HYPH|nr:CaiB/BaiF CoA-transferase family protein [Kaistia dalseonensis]MCX5493999.1 CaiB/BaiF CoA-transferase family protein [Kaistia dalseonensis]MDQ0436576.1 crotonobetainyl-CoA:carnitine CoA-transferase CaiB-like acyl-CoA transferase [Kaistia dalseonensis]
MMKPLKGVRVLELARVLAGPWAGQLLADLGADVVKVERPGAGDDTRAWGPPFIPGEHGAGKTAAYFHSTNRGKRSVTADFDNSEDHAMVLALAAEADVVLENYKVGGLKKYGLDYASLSAVNPALVYCSITGFGQDGPYAPRAGYDFIIQGMAGIMDLTGEPDGEPQKVGVAYADIFTGLYASNAIVAALYQRRDTGAGVHIDMALLDTQVAVLANQAMNYLASGVPPHRLGNAHPNIVPYQLFRTADRDIIIASGNDGQFRRICTMLGLDLLSADPRFATNAARVANRSELVPILAEAIANRSSADMLAALEQAGVPAGPINDLEGVFADPQVVHRGMARALARDDGSTVPSVRSPIVFDGEPAVAETASPDLGSSDRSIRSALASGHSPWGSET